MRQIVKTKDGELTYGSMVEVRTLYEQGFIGPEDLIRPEDSSRWVKASTLSTLRNAQSRGTRETGMGVRVAVAIAASIALAGLFEHARWLFIGGLVFMAVLTPFVVYRRSR
jgi:hypothetical protein